MAVITCPPYTQVSFDQILHSNNVAERPLGLNIETEGFVNDISVQYLFFLAQAHFESSANG